ncbi:MAG: HAMP domain-containing sensor histidine kinase [Candidatus Krumholzibacteriia bacterium]
MSTVWNLDQPREHEGDSPRVRRNLLEAAPHVAGLCQAMPWPVLILDAERRLVLANDQGLTYLDGVELDAVAGALPGELLQCRNLAETPAGCGTGQRCGCCDLRIILEESGTDGSARRACTIATCRGLAPLEFDAVATPFELGDATFTVLAFVDRRGELRRRTLERLFFHDIQNTAGNVASLAALAPQVEPAEALELLDLLQVQARHMLEEIRSQRDLAAAENGDLKVELESVSVVRLIADVVDAYRHHPLASGRELVMTPGPAVRAAADPTLLSRCIGNLVKNALEATPLGGRVTVAHGIVDDRIEIRVQNPQQVPADVRPHLLRRPVSSKGRDRGLGVYSVRLLIEDYLKGTVTFTSDHERGTVFRIRLGAPVGSALVR